MGSYEEMTTCHQNPSSQEKCIKKIRANDITYKERKLLFNSYMKCAVDCGRQCRLVCNQLSIMNKKLEGPTYSIF